MSGGQISDSSFQTTLKVGAGYSIDESWSVEAVAIVGMEHETSIPSLSGRIYTERSVFPTTILEMSWRLISTSD